VAGLVGLAGLTLTAPTWAGSTAPARPGAEQGVRWSELKPAQQTALRPLEREWPGIAADQKQKWLQLSQRVPSMTPAEQARVQERMVEWARLSPQQRGQARLNFEEAKKLPPQDRQARWEAYQALTPEQRQQLAARARPAASAASDAGHHAAPPRADKAAHDAPLAKSNIVPNPALAAPPTAITPTVVRAPSGATTTPVSKQPTPPVHQQSGLPKIAATPEYVNKATLLPHRGPQGEATRSAAAPVAGGASQQ